MQFRQSLRRTLEKPSLESQLTPLPCTSCFPSSAPRPGHFLKQGGPCSRVGPLTDCSSPAYRGSSVSQLRLRMVSVLGESGSCWRAAHWDLCSPAGCVSSCWLSSPNRTLDLWVPGRGVSNWRTCKVANYLLLIRESERKLTFYSFSSERIKKSFQDPAPRCLTKLVTMTECEDFKISVPPPPQQEWGSSPSSTCLSSQRSRLLPPPHLCTGLSVPTPLAELRKPKLKPRCRHITVLLK